MQWDVVIRKLLDTGGKYVPMILQNFTLITIQMILTNPILFELYRPWNFSETTFSNEYFRLLVEERWSPKLTHNGQPWDGPDQYGKN